jgi:hypothetical protein
MVQVDSKFSNEGGQQGDLKYNKMYSQMQDIWDSRAKMGAGIFVLVTMFRLAVCPFSKTEAAGS